MSEKDAPTGGSGPNQEQYSLLCRCADKGDFSEWNSWVARDKPEIKLARANLANLNLMGIQLQSARLEGADLRTAILKGVYLNEADLREADLTNADLSEAHLEGAYLDKTKLLGTKCCMVLSAFSRNDSPDTTCDFRLCHPRRSSNPSCDNVSGLEPLIFSLISKHYHPPQKTSYARILQVYNGLKP